MSGLFFKGKTTSQDLLNPFLNCLLIFLNPRFGYVLRIHLITTDFQDPVINHIRVKLHLLQESSRVITKTQVLIATYCLEHDIPLLQSDRDFLPFTEHLGLQLVP